MTIIICKVNSGMCNRLIPFITSYRLAMEYNLKYYLNWDDNCGDADYKYEGNKTKYNDMFEYIENVNYININMNNLLNNKEVLVIDYMNTDLHIYSINDLLKYNVIFFNNYVHPIFIKEDNVVIKNYSNISWILNKTDYYKNIQKYFELLKPINIIQDKIDEVLLKYPENKNNIIGFHIRHWPQDWQSKNIKILEGNNEERLKIMDKSIIDNVDVKFYICSTNKESIDFLVSKYGTRIIYFENRFGNNINDKYYSSDKNKSTGNIYKNLNGVVDLYLLSKCNLIIGDVASSYSICSPLLNSNSTYKQIKITSY